MLTRDSRARAGGTPRRAGLAALLAGVGVALAAAPAPALVTGAQTLDGPSADIGALGGVAMADDGTGGLVYEKVDGGRTHVFAARYADGRWLAPQRVDAGQVFASRAPRIGAAPGGRLVVTWVREAGDADELVSSVLPEGSSVFRPATVVDFEVADGTDVDADVATNAAGEAVLVYRVVTNKTTLDPGLLAQGFAMAQIRLARFNGTRWSRLGTIANRNASVPLRSPGDENAPRVALDVTGNGVVAWQEPDDGLVDRIWARRLFGSRLGRVQQVSPSQYGGAPLTGAATQPAVDAGGYGRGAIAFLQLPGERSRLEGPRVFSTTFATSFAGDAVSPAPATVVPGQDGAGGAAPSVDLDQDDGLMIGFRAGAGGAVVGLAADAAPAIDRLPDSTPPADPQVELAAFDRSVLAWRAGDRVALQERREGKAVQQQEVAAAAGGPVETLLLAGSGRGDALAAFAQGGEGARQIAGAAVDAPPAPFAVATPPTWTRADEVDLTWEPAADATSGPLRYTVQLDGRAIARQAARSLALRTTALTDGTHRVVIRAVDARGQRVDTTSAELKVDRTPPSVRVTRRDRVVTVRVADGTGSGAPDGATTVAWGDKRSTEGASRSARHTYRRAGGRFRVVVTTADEAGNETTVRRTIRIPRSRP